MLILETNGEAVSVIRLANDRDAAVPCYRVVGANGARAGYALGAGMKQTLLKLEQKHCPE